MSAISKLAYLVIPTLVYSTVASVATLIVCGCIGMRVDRKPFLHGVIPLTLWLLCVVLSDKGKTLTNMVVEPVMLGVGFCCCYVLYAACKRHSLLPSTILDGCLAAALAALTCCTYFLTPSLPE